MKYYARHAHARIYMEDLIELLSTTHDTKQIGTYDHFGQVLTKTSATSLLFVGSS